MQIKETISQKADRLKQSHRVILLRGDHALVIGDHDTYDVKRHFGHWRCQCRWARYRGHWQDCAHVIAVRRAWKDPASQVPVARLADLLTAKGGV